MSEDSERLVRELEREQHKGGGLFFTARDPRTGEVYREPSAPAQAAALIAQADRREESG